MNAASSTAAQCYSQEERASLVKDSSQSISITASARKYRSDSELTILQQDLARIYDGLSEQERSRFHSSTVLFTGGAGFSREGQLAVYKHYSFC